MNQRLAKKLRRGAERLQAPAATEYEQGQKGERRVKPDCTRGIYRNMKRVLKNQRGRSM